MAEDGWSQWLARGRSGGDRGRAAAIASEAEGYARRVLARVPLETGSVVVDVGCGEGMAGLIALTESPVHVMFCDSSPALVERARTAVERLGLAGCATFAVNDAATLESLSDETVDAVITRSVLAYVDDKRAAFSAMFRVLRPGGRISLFEPILRDAAFRVVAMRGAIAAADPDLELLHRWHALGLPDTLEGIRDHPLTNYDERSLFQAATAAGFVDVHVQLELDVEPAIPMRWEVALATAPVPGMPTLDAALGQHYSPDERARFEQRFRPLFEGGLFPPSQRAVAYLWAQKPRG